MKLGKPETTLVATIGICFAISLLAQQVGYSVALGAFLAGTLVAESGEAKTIEHLVQPVKDLFAAVFFVSVGMLIDPALVAKHWVAIGVLSVVVIAGKVIGVSFGAFLTGSSTRTSLQAGLSLAQIGEFSFIIAALGIALNATGGFLYPVAVTVSAITTLTTPWLIRASDPIASWVDRKLPKPLQTFASLYGSWIEAVRRPSPRSMHSGARLRRMVFAIFGDAAILGGIIIATARLLPRAGTLIGERVGISDGLARVVLRLIAFIVAVPFCVGIVRLSRRLGVGLAERALPGVAGGKVDLAAAPRKMLIVTLQLGGVLMVGVPLVAVTQPFLSGYLGALVLLLLIIALAFGFWRSATNLQGHVKAGAQAIVEVLASQARAAAVAELSSPSLAPHVEPLAQAHAILPGIGDPISHTVDAQSAAVGKTLAALNLRGLTGATVLAIYRGSEAIPVPAAQEQLEAEDTLALVGSHDAVAAAIELLRAPRDAPPPGADPPSGASLDRTHRAGSDGSGPEQGSAAEDAPGASRVPPEPHA